MYSKPGTNIMVTLRDGTTLAGKARFTFRWWWMRLDDVVVHTEHGPVAGVGEFWIPRSSVHYVQIGV
jgi:hypothetical protein